MYVSNLIVRGFGQYARESPSQSASWTGMSDVRSGIEVNSLTYLISYDLEFL